MKGSKQTENLARVAYSVAEVGEITGLGRTTIYKLMNEEKLPSVKVGRRRLVSAANVQRFLRDGFERGESA